jgi:predicted short-subunit dehydrogenase-like oxidoreductase (DUF2520 family)
MRELERDSSSEPTDSGRLAIVGAGRLGTALAGALAGGPFQVVGPLGRGAALLDAEAVLLCVPDGQISAAAALIGEGPLVGHCSGATGLDALAPHHEVFSLHPLMTVTPGGARFAGAGAAISASTARGREFALRLAAALEMRPFELSERDRTAYHAAASIASNFLITLEGAAERMATSAGAERSMLVPLVRATVENWAALGAERALTGPVARGDDATVAAQREAVADRAPELVPLFDALVDATRAQFLAHSGQKTASPVGAPA